MSHPPVASLSFTEIKESLKTYLRTQTAFRDYDFEESNMAVLLDVLAYNAVHHGWYVNMVFSEQFLDSSQLRDSVISHAKELNYIPKSRYSAMASVTLNLTTDVYTLSIPKGLQFTGKLGTRNFKFTTDRGYFHTSSDGTYSIDLDIYEGTYFQDVYVYDNQSETQRFIISNPNVDINSIFVTVSQNNGQNILTYTRAENLYDVKSNSQIFFLQGAENDRYEIVFGNNILGLKPGHSDIITIEYRVSDAGPEADGTSTFSLDEDPTTENGGILIAASVTTVIPASGGAYPEDLDSIKFNGPRHFAAQHRGVSTIDYASLVLNRFSGVIDDINVYGGETLEPKLYGRVVIALKPTNGTIATENTKAQVINYLKNLNSIPIRLIATDPEYFYLKVESTVQFDLFTSNMTIRAAKSIVSNAIDDFNHFLNKFDKDFRYSKLVAAIDNAHTSIISNETEVSLIKRIVPPINTPHSYSIEFGDRVESISSSKFTFIDSNSNVIESCYIRSKSNGVLEVYQKLNGIITVVGENVGAVNFKNGVVSLRKLRVNNYDNYISIIAKMVDKDVVVGKNQIIVIDPADVTVKIEETAHIIGQPHNS